jgi:serine/threonine-protein kinase
MTDVPDDLRSALADRYHIERPLGSGGMATVYLARDLKHDRFVALKVLRGEYAASLGSERFLREIDIAAKMTHPHILPLYDSGESDGFLYYVMPYVEGESLRARLQREKQLPLEDAIQIARQVADALGYAHKQGVVHRDIKPENILLEEGEAVVADFGIARAVTAAAGDTLTASGFFVGTPPYMSPEQATGEHELDARTDIYALGCVLHEMVTGEPPFSGRTVQAVIAQHLTEEPPSLREVRPETPPWLERVVHTALAKSPGERFTTAEHLSQSLAAHVAPRRKLRAAPWLRWMARLRRKRQLAYAGLFALLLVAGAYLLGTRNGAWGGGGRSGSSVATVAVLPFQDISEDGGAGYLAAGFTYYLAEYLGSVRGLAVVSPESMHRYYEEGFPIDSIVVKHELDMLIGGVVGVTDQQIEVSAGLTEAASGERLASIEPLARSRAEEALLLQDLAEEFGQLLRRELGNRIARIEAEAVTECGGCLEAVLQARALREQAESLRTAGDSSAAVAALDQADSLLVLAESGDPAWADPIVERGWVAAFRAGLTGIMRTYDAEWTRAGMDHAERALETDPSDPRALALRGHLRIFLAENSDDPEEVELLWDGAQSDLEQAVRLMPSLATAWSRLSYVYWERGDFERAKSAAERALEEDVWLHNDAITIVRLCQAVLELEQFQEVSHWCIEEGRLRFPDNPTFIYMELTLLASSVVGVFPDVNRAWGLADSVVQFMSPQRQAATRLWVDMDVAAVLARVGLEDSARAVIRRARAASPEENPRLDYHEANAWLQLREIEETLRLLERHLDVWPHRKSRIAKDWWFKPLRDHPEFQAIVE